MAAGYGQSAQVEAQEPPRCPSLRMQCTHQNVLNSQSYTFRNSPAMIINDEHEYERDEDMPACV
ncbi:hypothetical protein CH63R_01095 [Colletotrichum higginsianum IMI 349063]|uniref:Uncharacterized protein n=1 Tax=Colletotrichum higginsianum (strain IMI 349063) TaxID=759273 RepID=A0A1B7YV37_COLHI|nr:hypothetical protein CH63R_01095 [Colletotrichum higginsianum IMI 349063]OBR15915.1 hypothetical protein CH63R_01095 [Colletotrichum higginsianum IMI 349063]